MKKLLITTEIKSKVKEFREFLDGKKAKKAI